MSDAARRWLSPVGLCSLCRSGEPQPSARGTTFWRCLRAERDPAYGKYPPLPVAACPGFQALPGAAMPGAPRR